MGTRQAVPAPLRRIAHTWGFASTGQHDDYEDSYLPSGMTAGAPKKPSTVPAAYLNDPSWPNTRNGAHVPRNLVAQAAAIQRQQQAAHEPGAPVLLVAGPGSGKSATIEERVTHLVADGVTPEEIFAVSFTNASTRDLGDRVQQALIKVGITDAHPSVSTLHSLALRSLRRGNLIQTYPSDPQVLDRWEIRRLIDEEYVALYGGGLKPRQAESANSTRR